MSAFISDPYTIVQTAGETYIGNSTDQVYSINPNLIQAGDVVTIVDQGGTNAIELTAGLEITESIVTSNELVLTLSNGAIINVRGADTFTFNVGQNQAGGDTVGTEKTFTQFAQDILGVTLPAAGEDPVEGGSSTVNDDGTADVNPGSGTATEVSIDTGTPESPVAFNASGGAYEYSDDASVTTHVEISGFGSDDTIAFTNADVDNYAFANDGTDVVISYNYLDEGTMNVITLTGVVSSDAMVYDLASFTDAIGFDPFVV